jgi:hypothetical protein
MSKLYAEEQSIQTHYGKGAQIGEAGVCSWSPAWRGYPAEEDGQPVIVLSTPVLAFS